MVIRKFVPEDLPEILDTYQRAFAGEPWKETLKFSEVQRRWEEQKSFSNVHCVVATNNGKVIGATWWSDMSLDAVTERHASATTLRNFILNIPHGHFVWIWETIVDPESQERGVARQLKVEALEQIRKTPKRVLVMTRMREDNVRIRTLNQNLGMRQTGVFQPCSLTPGMQHQFWYMVTAPRRLRIGVLGASTGNLPEDPALAARLLQCAEAVGYALAQQGAIVVTGGTDGVMEAASRGALYAGGETIGTPGPIPGSCNPYVTIEINTPINVGDYLFVGIPSTEALVVFPGGAGTLAEVALAYRYKKPMVVATGFHSTFDDLVGKSLDRLQLVTIAGAATPEEIVALVLALASP
ncbi:MAG: GNAT family N-acetyltransferase [bacterium]|nr:GNAT family N-acetyltransferase [bacterium]